tara:strand:- start:394 stop:612 length:219 start_codon:yes stop_codon:yes gene_type:complete
MSYSLLSVSEHETSKLCLIDCGDGSTVELTFPIEQTEEEVLAGAVIYREGLVALKEQQEAEAAFIKENTDEQ